MKNKQHQFDSVENLNLRVREAEATLKQRGVFIETSDLKDALAVFVGAKDFQSLSDMVESTPRALPAKIQQEVGPEFETYVPSKVEGLFYVVEIWHPLQWIFFDSVEDLGYYMRNVAMGDPHEIWEARYNNGVIEKNTSKSLYWSERTEKFTLVQMKKEFVGGSCGWSALTDDYCSVETVIFEKIKPALEAKDSVKCCGLLNQYSFLGLESEVREKILKFLSDYAYGFGYTPERGWYFGEQVTEAEQKAFAAFEVVANRTDAWVCQGVDMNGRPYVLLSEFKDEEDESCGWKLQVYVDNNEYDLYVGALDNHIQPIEDQDIPENLKQQCVSEAKKELDLVQKDLGEMTLIAS